MSHRPTLFNLTPSKLSVSINEHVRWGDMDAFSHLNNTVFFRLFESARMSYFEKISFSEPAQNNGLAPILAHTECYFLKPLVYPQKLLAGTRISAMESDRFTMDYGLFIVDDKPVLAACGTGKIVCYDYDKGTRATIPKSVDQQIRKLEGSKLLPTVAAP